MSNKAPKRGRPAKPAAEKRSVKVLVSLTPAEARVIAAATDQPPAVYLREAGLAKATGAAKR